MKHFEHGTSYVHEGAKIGAGTKIWHFCHVMDGAKIGKNCIIGQGCFIASGARIGDRVKIQNNVSVYKGVTLEDDVFVGPSAVFTNVSNPRAFVDRKKDFQTTLVKRGATIGANATVVCGCTIGRYAFVGAGSVVTRDVIPFSLVFGNPASVRGWVCKCGEKLPLDMFCVGCGAKYEVRGEGIVLRRK